MSLDSVDVLGKALSGMAKEQDNIKSNIAPDEVEDQEQIFNTESVTIALAGTGIKRTYDSDSFVIDHPVYGDIDSSTQKIDGGYATAFLTMPVTVPITYGTTGEVIFTF